MSTTTRHRSLALTFIALLLAAATPASAADLVLQSGFVETDGERIYYESVGTGEAVVLSHGAGGAHAVWYQQVPVLAQKYRVITWDQRGFGRSTNVKDQSGPATGVQDLAALLDHLKITSAHVAGQSMGGWTVMGFALKYPERVRSLVLADTIGGVPTTRPMQALAAPGSATDPAQLPITRHPGLDDSLGMRDPAKAFLYRELGGATPPGVRERMQQTTYDIAAVRRLRLPVLMVVGERDTGFPPDTIRSVAAEIKGAQVALMPGAGHSPYFETPKAWNDAVMKFLASTPRS